VLPHSVNPPVKELYHLIPSKRASWLQILHPFFANITVQKLPLEAIDLK
jgi:hypothetical protein